MGVREWGAVSIPLRTLIFSLSLFSLGNLVLVLNFINTENVIVINRILHLLSSVLNFGKNLFWTLRVFNK